MDRGGPDEMIGGEGGDGGVEGDEVGIVVATNSSGEQMREH